ncbi:MAG: CcmD family protein [Candidatus Binatia bacterium]|nr:CcmD family protein [Candidatus Binatia bacterium]
MDSLHFLFAAYTAVWAMLFLYLWVMARRTRRLEEQLQELLRLLDQQSSGGSTPFTDAEGRRHANGR